MLLLAKSIQVSSRKAVAVAPPFLPEVRIVDAGNARPKVSRWGASAGGLVGGEEPATSSSQARPRRRRRVSGVLGEMFPNRSGNLIVCAADPPQESGRGGGI